MPQGDSTSMSPSLALGIASLALDEIEHIKYYEMYVEVKRFGEMTDLSHKMLSRCDKISVVILPHHASEYA
jgi:hypothetical protein